MTNSGQFKKGMTSWNKGKTGLPCMNGLKGKKMPKEWRDALKVPKSVTHPCSLQTRKKIADAQRGSKSHLWKGGLTQWHDVIRNSMEYKLWREAVFKRDNFTCTECKDDKGGNLQAHHIKPFSTHPELHFAIDNGVTLCVLCHQKTESYGGRQTAKNMKLTIKQ